MVLSIAAYFLAGVAVTLLYLYRVATTRRLPLPPGPKKLPFIGNLLDIPRCKSWEVYHGWSQQFGSDLVHLNVVGQDVVILDSLEAIHDLFEKRAHIYSGRPRSTMINDLMGWNFAFTFNDWTDLVKSHQRLCRQGLSPAEVSKYRPYMVRAARRLLRRLLDPVEQDDIMGNLRLLAGEITLTIVYGFNITSKTDPYIQMAERAVGPVIKVLVPGAYLVDSLPFMKYIPSWVPGAKFKKEAEEWHGYVTAVRNTPFEETKDQMSNGSAKVSYCSGRLNDLANDPRSQIGEEDIKNVSATMYGAGVDTMMSAVGNCLVVLMQHPEVFKRVQMELDTNIGLGHLPTFEDEASLPYFNAVMKECARWHDTAPVSLPHVCTEEDEYKGYRIPKGSLVISNTWSVLHSEELYPDPMSFNPERWLVPHQGRFPRDPDLATWGIGRRACPGRYLAASTVWITIASILASFDVEQMGNGDYLEHHLAPGMLRSPTQIKCNLRPRSRELASLINSPDSEES